ncbi:MAG: 2-oxoacid:acceptor oxidoreductase family protein [Dissulfurispiraceae bacterium]
MAENLEIRWHGRGGQGTVTAVKVFADACLSGGKHVQAFPEYGPERSGAPLRAFNRVSEREIRMHCPVSHPGIIVIVDPTLLDGVNVTEGALDNATFLVNSSAAPQEIRERLHLEPSQTLFVLDATKIALENIGRPMPNAPMVGALARVSGAMTLDVLLKDVKKSFGKKFSQKIIDGNLEATTRGYQGVIEG